MKKGKVHDNAIKNITETGALKMGEITEAKRAEVSEKNLQYDPNVIYIQMLGGFSMTYQGQPLLLGKSLSSKMLHLLMLLIYSRGEGIRRTQLLEQLYGDSDIEQAANSLRAMIFRLRKSLVAAGLPDGEYISTKGGIYMWAAEHVDVELDVEVFQKQVMAALEEKEPLKEVELLEEACRIYKGEFLPLMIADDWVASANWKYQELYFKVLRELSRLLKKQNRYAELLPYCEQALSRYPYEEWQLVKLECLTAMKEYKLAVEYYEQIAKESQQEYGIRMSEGMMEHYRAIRNMIQYEMNNIEEIQQHLRPDPNVFGATRCDYLTFIDIYRYISGCWDGKIPGHIWCSLPCLTGTASLWNPPSSWRRYGRDWNAPLSARCADQICTLATARTSSWCWSPAQTRTVVRSRQTVYARTSGR